MATARFCIECKERKNHEEFWARTGKCKICDPTFPERHRARYQDYKARNRDKELARKREYRRKNKEKIQAYNKAYYESHPQETHWRKLYPETAKAQETRRRGYKVSETFPPGVLKMKLHYYGGKCWICRTNPYEHWDHVKPLAKGGAHILANIRPSCADCNLAKGDKWPFKIEDITGEH